jgi:FlaA1/EpsC-like NDP-sugar epimerase
MSAPTRRAALLAPFRRLFSLAQLGLDAGAWAIAVPAAIWARLDFDLDAIDSVRYLRFSALAVVIQAVAGLLFGLYRSRWRYATFEEAGAAARSVVLTTGLLYAANRWLLVERYVPESVPIAAGFGALIALGGYRYTYRILTDRRRRPDADHPDAQRALVFGAGEGGSQLLAATLRNRASTIVPVALLDDDPARRRLTIRGTKVVGTRDDMAAAAQRYDADTLIIAIPSASGPLIAELSDLARAAGLTVKVLPSLGELVRGAAVGEVRDVTEADLLGRHQVRTDINAAAAYLRGKKVLITGAGGSIGSELCRQVHDLSPARLLMLDRDESALHAVQLSLEGRALLDSPDLLLADLRDSGTIRRLFEAHRPDVVFHAAALKHLPLLEQAPGEAVQSNVWGTLTVLEAANAVGVERFVNVSTDKAANPSSVLGYSKRIAERLTAHIAATTELGTYLSVRFGNVLGSRGSVLGAFHAQVERGGPLTVTHPDVSRYFMTTEEAVQLVLQAGAIGRPGEVLILDMGEPVKIVDVAERLIAASGRDDIGIVFTGLRAGEKLHEELIGDAESDLRPLHPLITHAQVPALDPEEALKLAPWSTSNRELIDELARLC